MDLDPPQTSIVVVLEAVELVALELSMMRSCVALDFGCTDTIASLKPSGGLARAAGDMLLVDDGPIRRLGVAVDEDDGVQDAKLRSVVVVSVVTVLFAFVLVLAGHWTLIMSFTTGLGVLAASSSLVGPLLVGVGVGGSYRITP